MSRANPEQKLAIEHEGGVLLRAGAGSGKTFVLVEHIIYLTRKWIAEFEANPVGEFEDYIREKFSQVVMMTFTRKAAGEMSIRLSDKFAALVDSENHDYWKVVTEALPLLTVTTIDGFCRKLITGGYFPHLSSDADIIFTPERLNQVKKILESWFEQESHRVPEEILNIVVREKSSLLEAFGNIFNDPGLRLAWRKFSVDEACPSRLNELIEKSYTLNDLSSCLSKIHSLDLPVESERSPFEQIVASFQSTGLPEVRSVDHLKMYKSLFAPISVLRGQTGKKKSLSHDAAKEGLAVLRDWVNKWSEIVSDYEMHFSDKIKPWLDLCLELFQWVDRRLDPNQGMTFGDIEYFVAIGLEDKQCQERIRKTFRYFIVDEFQDTSELQFSIIRGLIKDEFHRLFCVGDAKQAIYGFRGGELTVFQDCAKLVPQVRSLANNYRSLPEIIRFNNSLFRAILPLGREFTGHDPFTVNPEDQNVPEELTPTISGAIEILTATAERDLETEGKFSSEEINRLEASIIADSIQKMRAQDPKDVCTVLYSKLKPSNELIRFLMERKIGFTAQFKIDLLDDPVMGIFLALLRRQFDTSSSTRDRYPLFIIGSYLKVLGLETKIEVAQLQEFDQNLKYWGLVPAFQKFMFKLNVTNENSDINLQAIETLASIYHQDPEAILIQITQGDGQRISLDLRSGEEAHMVQIMTAHASKGLEFDTVYLGGIYTNGKEMPEGSMFGALPGSFNWYIDLAQRDKRRSPYYEYERELSRYKDFSESKRLFYVACTRAKKKLFWTDLILPEKSFSVPKNSWIDGLRVWIETGFTDDCTESVGVRELKEFNSRALLESQSLPELPLFFYDSMGIHACGEGSGDLGLTPELSVTRLNSLLDCPRKFYFENNLKLTPSADVKVVFDDEPEELATAITSNAERGTNIHALIAKGIERNFTVAREVFDTADKAPIYWALNQLRDLSEEYELVPERQIKFQFFNYMISGIPDLILRSKTEQKTQVWDFKTGRITQDKLEHYWQQLSIYGYSLFVLGQVDKSHSIELVLSFVDEEQLLRRSISWEECRTLLYPIWRSQNDPWITNPDHCSQCSFKDICTR